jgi:aminoglycoside phosphotransferase (APT) family kinase protein
MVSPESLRAFVRRHLPDRQVTGIEPTRTGKFNDSFFVSTDDGELVVRVAPPEDAVFVFYERRMMRQEPGLHRLLREKTNVPVAAILAFDEKAEELGRAALIMERLPGVPLTEASGLHAGYVFRQVGGMLAATHALTAERYGYLGEHHPMDPAATWVEAFADMWDRLVADVAATGHYSPATRRFLHALLTEHLDLFDRPVAASLLHMDVWHQNIQVAPDGTVTGLIDWDRALWGDPEIEFAVLDYCGVSVPEFWQGYGQPRDLSPDAQVRRVFYLLYELQKYIVIRHGRNHDPAGAERYRAQVADLVQEAFGVSLP